MLSALIESRKRGALIMPLRKKRTRKEIRFQRNSRDTPKRPPPYPPPKCSLCSMNIVLSIQLCEDRGDDVAHFRVGLLFWLRSYNVCVVIVFFMWFLCRFALLLVAFRRRCAARSIQTQSNSNRRKAMDKIYISLIRDVPSPITHLICFPIL